MTSEHRRQLGLKEEQEEENEETNKKEEETKEEIKEEEPWDACEGYFPDTCCPPPPVLNEQVPNDLPQEENQEPPAEDEWLCPVCKSSSVLFLQYQDDLECHVDIMYPKVTNKQKRYHMYRHMSQRLNGPLSKGNHRPLPGCFTQGLRELFPSDDYVGFKPSPFESGPRGDYDRDRDDGSTYA